MKRLSLRTERLTDLTAADLAAVVGALDTGLRCATQEGVLCQLTEACASHDTCLTQHCSLDVC